MTLKVVAISDTHGQHHNMRCPVPDGDILIHAGDFTSRGGRASVQNFAEWIGGLPHRHKLVIPGNHDEYVEIMPEDSKRIMEELGVHLLLHQAITIEGVQFFGSPYTPEYFDWSFMQRRGAESQRRWEDIPHDTDVVITHGPPYGHGDRVPARRGGEARLAGCLELLRRLCFVKPKYHICGHIHEGYGVTVSDEAPETVFINASICTEGMRPKNAPIVFEL